MLKRIILPKMRLIVFGRLLTVSIWLRGSSEKRLTLILNALLKLAAIGVSGTATAYRLEGRTHALMPVLVVALVKR